MSTLNKIKGAIARRFFNEFLTVDQLYDRYADDPYNTPGLVGKESAMRIMTVYSCVQVISQSIAGLPLNVLRREGPDRNAYDDSHPLHKLFSVGPNELQTTSEFLETMLWDLVLTGRAFARITRGVRGGVVALIPIHVDRVRVEVDKGRLKYYLDNKENAEPEGSIFDLKGYSPDGYFTCSPIELHSRTLDTSKEMADMNNAIYKKGMRSSAFIIMGEAYTAASQEAKALFSEKLKAFSGAKGAGRYMTLDSGSQVVPASITSVDADFLDSMKFTRAEIASIFRVPLHKINDLDRATFSNIEHQSLEFYKDTLKHWITRVEQAINKALFNNAERGQYFVKFDTDELIQGDYKTRMEGDALAIINGIISVNESRAKLGYNPVSGGELHFRQLNLTTLDNTGPVGVESQ